MTNDEFVTAVISAFGTGRRQTPTITCAAPLRARQVFQAFDVGPSRGGLDAGRSTDSSATRSRGQPCARNGGSRAATGVSRAREQTGCYGSRGADTGAGAGRSLPAGGAAGHKQISSSSRRGRRWRTVPPPSSGGSRPVYRPLKIFTLDPSISRLDGRGRHVAGAGPAACSRAPRGLVFEVDNDDGHQRNQRVDLDDPLIVMSSGLDPTPSDPRFHQQMVYAVASSVYAVFATALGRQIAWSFRRGRATRKHGSCSGLTR